MNKKGVDKAGYLKRKKSCAFGKFFYYLSKKAKISI